MKRGFWKEIKKVQGGALPKNAISSGAWVDHFMEVYGVKDQGTDNQKEESKDLVEAEELDKEISTEELQWAFNKLKSGKAGKLDGLSSDFF